MTKKGISSTVVYVTRGEKLYNGTSHKLAEQRRNEAKRASKLLGCKEGLFLDFPDGEIAHHAEDVYEKLRDIVVANKPDVVFSPSPVDYHDDHIATSEIALKLFSNLNSFKLAFYEVYSTLKFTHLIDITEVIEQKEAIILNYHTSLYGKPDVYVKASLGLNAHRSIFTQKKGYYEAFYILEEEKSLEFILKDICYRNR